MFIRFWIKRYWMIEGSLKFHSEKMSFEKSKTRYPKTRLSCSHCQESEGFLSCLWQRIWSAIHFRLRSLKPRRKLQVMQARRQNRVDRQTPDRDGWVVWLGVKTGPNVFPKMFKKFIEIFYRVGTSVRCSQTFLPIIFFISWFS